MRGRLNCTAEASQAKLSAFACTWLRRLKLHSTGERRFDASAGGCTRWLTWLRQPRRRTLFWVAARVRGPPSRARSSEPVSCRRGVGRRAFAARGAARGACRLGLVPPVLRHTGLGQLSAARRGCSPRASQRARRTHADGTGLCAMQKVRKAASCTPTPPSAAHAPLAGGGQRRLRPPHTGRHPAASTHRCAARCTAWRRCGRFPFTGLHAPSSATPAPPRAASHPAAPMVELARADGARQGAEAPACAPQRSRGRKEARCRP